MALPAYSDEDHDVGLGAPGAVKGWMRLAGGQLTRGDALPGTARSASGESRFDIFTQDAFIAQADYGGGVGQARFVKSDTILSGLGDGRFQGHYFPARAAKTAYDGGSTYQYVETDHLGTPRAVVHPTKNTIIWRWNLNDTTFGDHAPLGDPDSNGITYTLALRYPGQRALGCPRHQPRPNRAA